MALQILPAGTPRRNLAAEFAGNFTSGLMEGGYEGLERKREKLKSERENKTLKELTGIDFSDLSPEMKKIALSQSLKTKGQKELKAEENKFLDKLFGGEKRNSSKIKEQLLEGDQNLSERPNLNENPIDGYNVEDLTDEDVVRAEVMRHGLGHTLASQKSAAEKKISGKEKETRRQFESDRAFHSKISDPVIEAANSTLKEEPLKKGLNSQLRKDIQSGNTSGLFPFMVDKLGLESFRNPESARFTSEIKNKFVASLQDIPGARPNMFLERVLSTAQPQIGRSEEANLSVMDLSDFVDDLNYERAKQIRNLAKEDRKNFGYVRNDIEERADEKLGNYANKRQEQMAYDIRKRHEDYIEDDIDLLDEVLGKKIPQGTPVTRRVMRLLMIKNKDDAKKAVEEAKSLGMVFPSKEAYERYED